MKKVTGILSIAQGVYKVSPRHPDKVLVNNLTIRNNYMPQEIPTMTPSSDIEHANLKALRFYRKVCRLIPFMIRTHYLSSRITIAEAKQNVAELFRKEPKTDNLAQLDQRVQRGYQDMMEVQWHLCYHSATYDTLAPIDQHRDRGYSYINDRFNKKEKKASPFLKDFYKGNRTPIF